MCLREPMSRVSVCLRHDPEAISKITPPPHFIYKGLSPFGESLVLTHIL